MTRRTKNLSLLVLFVAALGFAFYAILAFVELLVKLMGG